MKSIQFQAHNKLPVPVNLLWEHNGIKRVALIGPGLTITMQHLVAKGNDDDDQKDLVFTAFEAGTSNVALVNDDREFNLKPTSEDDKRKDSDRKITITPGTM